MALQRDFSKVTSAASSGGRADLAEETIPTRGPGSPSGWAKPRGEAGLGSRLGSGCHDEQQGPYRSRFIPRDPGEPPWPRHAPGPQDVALPSGSAGAGGAAGDPLGASPSPPLLRPGRAVGEAAGWLSGAAPKPPVPTWRRWQRRAKAHTGRQRAAAMSRSCWSVARSPAGGRRLWVPALCSADVLPRCRVTDAAPVVMAEEKEG